jgi:hypothetical protein
MGPADEEIYLMRSAQDRKGVCSRGMSLIEVTISITLVTMIVLGALMVRYHAVKHAVRADAYSTAGRIGQLFLEGWRSVPDANGYEPYDRLTGQVPITVVDSGPDVTSDSFTTYTSPKSNTYYEVVLDGRYFYVALGKIAPIMTVGAERPEAIHVAVAFRNDYGPGDISSGASTVRLTTYK